jgi:hypothetical protein
MRQLVLIVILVFGSLFFIGCSSNSKTSTSNCPTYNGSRMNPAKDLKKYAAHTKALKKSRHYSSNPISARRRPKGSKGKVILKNTIRGY